MKKNLLKVAAIILGGIMLGGCFWGGSAGGTQDGKAGMLNTGLHF